MSPKISCHKYVHENGFILTKNLTLNSKTVTTQMNLRRHDPESETLLFKNEATITLQLRVRNHFLINE